MISLINRTFIAMKSLIKILVISLLVVFGGNSFSQEKINWMSWETAIEKNKTVKKKIIVDVYTWWCGWCKRMDATTFSNNVIIKEINKHYDAVKLDAEQQEPITYKGKTYINEKPNSTPNVRKNPHQFAVVLLSGQMGYPKFVLLDENEQLLQMVTGYKQAPEMEMILKFFGDDIYKTVSGEEFKKTFQSELKPN